MSSGRGSQEIVPHSGDLEVPVEPTDVRRQDSLYLDATRPAHAGHHRQVHIHSKLATPLTLARYDLNYPAGLLMKVLS